MTRPEQNNVPSVRVWCATAIYEEQMLDRTIGRVCFHARRILWRAQLPLFKCMRWTELKDRDHECERQDLKTNCRWVAVPHAR